MCSIIYANFSIMNWLHGLIFRNFTRVELKTKSHAKLSVQWETQRAILVRSLCTIEIVRMCANY